MNAILNVDFAKPSKKTLRLAVLATIVEEVGPSHNVRAPEECPVITMAARVLDEMGLAQETWSQGEIAILMGVTDATVNGIETRALGTLRNRMRRDADGIVGELRLLETLRDEATMPEGCDV
jgi:hypothetical protein